jgi:hypothetical protein
MTKQEKIELILRACFLYPSFLNDMTEKDVDIIYASVERYQSTKRVAEIDVDIAKLQAEKTSIASAREA